VAEEVKERKGIFGRLFRKKGEESESEAESEGEETAAESASVSDADEIPLPATEASEPLEKTDVTTPEARGGGKQYAQEPSTPKRVPEEGLGPEAAAVLEPVPEDEPGPAENDRKGLFARLRSGLAKTHRGFVEKVDRVLAGKKEIDAATLEELEEALVTADLGVQTSMQLIEGIQERLERKELANPEALREHLKSAVLDLLVADEGHFEIGDQRPHVVMVVGVNGVGKTTTIGKIAAQYRDRGSKVILAAADTFRAAAIEQLEIWGQRAGAQVVRHQHGSDPAAVAFDAVEAAKARGADLVVVDTAGRLHTKINLMEELKKVKRVIGKALPGAPHEVLLILDATTGQNAISQAQLFHQAVGVDSIALTKLDGTAKGGVIVGICGELKIPIQFIGIGEKVDDLRPFDAEEFVEALF
jgi:fused signal recognition particle receptor